MTRAELRKCFSPGCQIAKNDMQPDSVNSHPGAALEQTIGIRIQFRVQQRISVDSQIRVHQSQGNELVISSFRRRERRERFTQAFYELESRFCRLLDF